jgi:hypothetical protein
LPGTISFLGPFDFDGEFRMGLDVAKKGMYFGIDESDQKKGKECHLIPLGQILEKDSSRPYF